MNAKTKELKRYARRVIKAIQKIDTKKPQQLNERFLRTRFGIVNPTTIGLILAMGKARGMKVRRLV